MTNAEAAAAIPAPQRSAAKQAVILIHGMGEQIPMDTIKGFVETVWECDTAITANGLPNPSKVWSKPDDRTGSLELRRITTRESIPSTGFPHGVRTDFYELYWADLTAGSTWDQLFGWIRNLLFRPWSRVPSNVRGAWLLLWLAFVLVTLIAGIAFIPEDWWTRHAPSWLPQKSLLAISAALGTVLGGLASRTFGRVVRYTVAKPDNIAARAAVRSRGLALLRALHANPSYQRVVLVGHSLGSILAYDLLSYFWSEQAGARTIQTGSQSFAALCEVERAARALEARDDGDSQQAYAAAQAGLHHALVDASAGSVNAKDRWLISDLVTIGSPLTHAEFLLAGSSDDLSARQSARELPVSPPYREMLDDKVLAAAQATAALPIDDAPETTRLMAFPDLDAPGRWVLHHAAPFAATRWTNLFDPANAIVFGDLISGPLKNLFGTAIKDINLAVRDKPSWRFTHTSYWRTSQAPSRLIALREALNLLDR
jgi:hypothetical protein